MTQATAPTDTALLAQTIENALAQHTLCGAFQVTAAANGDRPALRTLGAEREYTWREYAEEVRGSPAGCTPSVCAPVTRSA